MNAHNWLPKGTKEPKTKSNYTMPLDEGQTKIRVLSSAVVGEQTWKQEGEKKVPERFVVGEAPLFGDDGKEPQYFWAFLVFNYTAERVQIMQITQKNIRTKIQAYLDNDAWGDPKKYDLVITRTGTKLLDTVYEVVANPHSDYKGETPDINLDEWFKGNDPFEKKELKDGEVAEPFKD